MKNGRLAACVMLLIALGSAAVAAEVTIPEVEKGRFNVAFVYVGPIGDGGWSYSHDQGRRYLEKMLPSVHTAYVESVAEGAEAEQVIRSLARKRFDLIVATSFGFMDACEVVAGEFPNVKFLHISGFKKNDRNFGNLMGAMECMKYLAGMVAGARAKADGVHKIGYIAPFPIAEVIRLGNAIALGMKRTCPECVMEIRWINTWFDPVKEREAAESLIKNNVDVVITGADTQGPVIAAGEAGKWGIGYDSENACSGDPRHCLTVPYWNWGVEYVRQVKAMMDGTWKPDNYYPDADSGIVGLFGFMEGQEPATGVPPEVVEEIRAVLNQMQDGAFTRFDVFKGPLRDNRGVVRVPAGTSLTQEDMEGLKNIPGRQDCSICMDWLVEGIIGEVPGK
ncbi:BMP family ABC transporter substrate-binding protein [bacterium]|nr:BMP family ABC transporter substrate-binding protein [candidate division CSSED10-310 bacterium]